MTFQIENRFHATKAIIQANPVETYDNRNGESVAIISQADAERLYAEDRRVNCHSPHCLCEQFATDIISPDVAHVGIE